MEQNTVLNGAATVETGVESTAEPLSALCRPGCSAILSGLGLSILAAAGSSGCGKPMFIGDYGAVIDGNGLSLMMKIHIPKPQDRWPGKYPLHDIASHDFVDHAQLEAALSEGDQQFVDAYSSMLERTHNDLRWFVKKEDRWVNERHPDTGEFPLDLAFKHKNVSLAQELLMLGAKGSMDTMAQSWRDEEILRTLYVMVVNHKPLNQLCGEDFKNPIDWLSRKGYQDFLVFVYEFDRDGNGQGIPELLTAQGG